MSKKRLYSRLDTLFTGMDEQSPVLPAEKPGALVGWTWESSADGVYRSISPEVEQCLGIPASAFLGMRVTDFAVDPNYHARMADLFSPTTQPVDDAIGFLDHAGAQIPVRVHVFPRTGDNGHSSGWRGFCQLIPKGKTGSQLVVLTLTPDFIEPITPSISHTPQRPKAPVQPWPVNQEPVTGTPNLENIPISHPDIPTGIVIEDGKIKPGEKPLTPAGQVSLQENRVVVQPSGQEGPATIALPFQYGQDGKGLLEIVADDNRLWSEDEKLLVQEVANQLALAIENARLYAVVQQELAERTRAEQEIRRRSEDLAALNRVGQELSRLASSTEIVNIVDNTIERLAGSQNLIIGLVQAQQLTFPLYRVNGKLTQPANDDPIRQVIQHALQTRKVLLFNDQVTERLEQVGITDLLPVPMSLLVIPMLAGDRPTGVVVLQDYTKKQAFSSIVVDLLSTVAAQATTALENANLFAEIRNALASIENRERYESNVARAVATLTEFGSRSLHEVLSILGQAAQAHRVYFAEVREGADGPEWQAAAIWTDPAFSDRLGSTPIQHIPVSQFAYWASRLQENGVVSDPIEKLPQAERDFLTSQNILASLLLAVPGKQSVSSFIAFDQLENRRPWLAEEIGVLRVASDALSNTVIREDLLEQLQSSLDETENLYNASHRLALANDMQEMVAAITSGMQPSPINRAELILFDTDGMGRPVGMRVEATWHSGRGAPPVSVNTKLDMQLYSRLLFGSAPTFYDDVADSTLDESMRTTLQEAGVRSMAVLPLWAARRQTGALLLSYNEWHHFSGREIRSYPPLIDQMATSIENLRLFTQTQEALAETEQLYHISSGIAQARDAQDLIMLVAKDILPTHSERVTLIRVVQMSENLPVELEMVGHFEKGKDYHRLGVHIPISMLPLASQIGVDPLTLTDVAASGLDDTSKNTLIQFNILSACIVALRSAGRLTGMLIASSSHPAQYDAEQVHLMQVAGNGIAVALERQTLLEEARRRALELEAAADIARDTTSTLALDELLSRIVNLVAERFTFDHASILLMDDNHLHAVVAEATGEIGAVLKQQGYRVKVGARSVVGAVLAKGNTVTVNDVETSSFYSPTPLLPNIRSEMGLPLKLGDRIIGVLDIQDSQPNAFSNDDIAVLQILADQIAVAIDNARSYALAQKAIEEMREVDRLKSQFLANMSHELRTPLNSIIGFSRVILKGIDGPINEIQEQDLTAIYNSGQHLLNLINNILDLSKIEANKMEISIVEMDMAEIIRSVMSTAIGLVKDKPIELKQVIPAELPVVSGDATRIRQVLLNLVSNAAKFTEEGSITVEVEETRSDDGKPEIMVKVTDTGLGIAAEDEGKLFQPFSQVDDSPTRKTGGTGLGLSICRSLIELHGGRIGLLCSEIGKGSTFYFTLPVTRPMEEPAPADDSGQLTILAVDDDAQVIQLYERYLHPQGYTIIPVTNPQQALEKALEVRPMAITLDIMMPEKDGWTVLQELKGNPVTRNIPVIICSILEEEEKGIQLGAADYLVKPFLREDLLNAVNRLNPDGSIHNILIVDDDEADQRLIQKILDETGHFNISLSNDGEQAWQSIQQAAPDVVIMDLFMPGLDGFGLLERLKLDPKFSAIPVLVISGADLTAEQHHQLAQFGQHLFAKGYLQETELLATLEAALNKIRG